MKIFEEFEKKIARYEELQKLIADPKVISDKALFRKYTKELSDISGAVMKYNQFLKVKRELDEVEGELERNLVEPDYIELAQSEKKELEEKVARLAEDLEELLITWLNELISLFFTYKFVPLSYSIVIEEEEDQKILKSFIKGATLDCQKHRLKAEVKAATYHSLKIEKLDTGYVAEVIFDV